MKKIYRANLRFNCQYTEGWFKKRTITAACVFTSKQVVLAETEEEATEKIKKRDVFWSEKYHLPWYGWNDENLNRTEYTILDKTIESFEVDSYTFDDLKIRLRADEFLAYCRQELYSLEVLIK